MMGLERFTRRAIITAGRFCLMPALAFFFAVTATSNPARADFTKAVYHGKAFCPKGTHFSARKGGQCWDCPSGTKRTLLPITGKKACKKKSRKLYKRAASIKKDKKACKNAGLIWRKKQCWSCAGGYKRSLSGITSAKACVRKIKAKHYKAKYVQDFGCGIGLYMSIKKFGQCFKCPAGHKFRTINKLTGPKACTNSFAQVFAADTTGFCRKVVGAIRDGSNGMAKLRKSVGKVIDPAIKPVAKIIDKATPDLKSPKAVTKFLRKLDLANPRNQPVMEELARVVSLNQSPAKFSKVVLNPDMVCSGNPAKVNKALMAAGLRKNLKFKKAGLLDGLIVSSAHAASYNENAKTVLHVISASGDVKLKGYPFAFAPSIAIVTDLGPRFHVYLSFGGSLTSSPSSGAALGYMIFPSAAIKGFKGINLLGLEAEFGLRRLIDVVSRNKTALARLECIKDRADGIGNRRKKCGWDGDVTFNVSFSPKTATDFRNNIPGIGVTWNPHYDSGSLTPGKGPRQASFTADYSIKIFGK